MRLAPQLNMYVELLVSAENDSSRLRKVRYRFRVKKARSIYKEIRE